MHHFFLILKNYGKIKIQFNHKEAMLNNYAKRKFTKEGNQGCGLVINEMV